MTPSDTGVAARNTATRRDMLRHFLQSRRARLSPRDPRFVTVGRRGTPGLRREEVALLAGVSVSWYTWLEQGRDIKVSAKVLDAVSAALRLNAAERAHLYRLTGVHPLPAVPRSASHGITRLTRLVDNWPDHPAYITDRHWNNMAANRLAHTTLHLPLVGHNHLSAFSPTPAPGSGTRSGPKWRAGSSVSSGPWPPVIPMTGHSTGWSMNSPWQGRNSGSCGSAMKCTVTRRPWSRCIAPTAVRGGSSI